LIEFSVDMTPLEMRLRALSSHMENPPMKEVGDVIVESTVKTFAAGGRPEAWIANKKGTPTLGGPASSLVRNTVITGMGQTFVEVTGGKGLPYASIHQLGGIIKHPGSDKLQVFIVDGKTVFTRHTRPHDIPIPARRWFRIQDEDVTMIVSLIKTFILQEERNG
jgi:phage gpG-like protein